MKYRLDAHDLVLLYRAGDMDALKAAIWSYESKEESLSQCLWMVAYEHFSPDEIRTLATKLHEPRPRFRLIRPAGDMLNIFECESEELLRRIGLSILPWLKRTKKPGDMLEDSDYIIVFVG